MVKQICCSSYTIEDPIVLDGIKAIEQIKKETNIAGHIAGGMGVQGYIPHEFHRKTIDLDFSMFWCGNTEEYKKMTLPLKSFLEEQGYDVELRKRHSTYDYTLLREGTSFIIQHRKESRTHFEKGIKKSLEREIANHQTLVRGGVDYQVLSPEDLAIHKLSRAGIFARRYGIKKPIFISLPILKKNLTKLREDLLSHFDDISPEEIVKLRLLCDLFDVKCLSEYVGFDKSYFTEIIGEYTRDFDLDTFEVYQDLNNLQIDLK